MAATRRPAARLRPRRLTGRVGVRCLVLLPVLLLAGCGARNSSSDEAIATFSLTTRANITDYAVWPDQLKRAAAVYFRALAVAAPTEADAALARRVREALYTEKGVHRSLAANVRGPMEAQLAALDQSLQRGDRKGVTVAALEVYRLLTEDTATQVAVPTPLTLIDYAQLAGAAQLDSPSPDWDAIDAALGYADRQWRGLVIDLPDPSIGDDLGASLDRAQAAAERRDRAATKQALGDVRAPYDRLVTHFKRA